MSTPPTPQLCVGAIVVDGGSLLLVRRGQAPGAGEWSVPGGRVEPGETLHEAVVRGLLGWRTAPRGHVDVAALDVLADLLCCGRRSRLWQSLVETDGLCVWVEVAHAAVQRGGQFSSQKRIDGLFYRGSTPVIIEAKDRVDPSCLGQVLTYRSLYMADHADEPTPDLIVIGRSSDPDTLRVLNEHGITVYLYESA